MRCFNLGVLSCSLLVIGCQSYGFGSPPDDGGEPPDSAGDTGADRGTDGQDGDPRPDDGPPARCPTFIGALADCPLSFVHRFGSDPCPEVLCRQQPCANDSECPAGEEAEFGTRCVQGNCVFCVQDGQCPDGQLCRTGRCVEPITGCPPAPPCTEEYCRLVSPSELPCPVCVCGSFFDCSCRTDTDCADNVNWPSAKCVYGRCVGCINDDDCGDWRCLTPGLCMKTDPHPSQLFGTWLIGWSGDLEHRSYFRFEPDGTFRRGSYTAAGPFADDVPPFPCQPSSGIPGVTVGTWEVDISEAPVLHVTISLNISCDPGAGFVGRRVIVNFAADGKSATFDSIDLPKDLLDGWKVSTETCAPDMNTCEPLAERHSSALNLAKRH